MRVVQFRGSYTRGACERCHIVRECQSVFYYVDKENPNQMIAPFYTTAYMHDLLCASCILSDNEVKSLLLARALRGRS